MSNLVEVKIPTNANPFNVRVNGKKYSYPAGATVMVPPEVAEVIEQIGRGPNLPPSSGGGSSGGGGADLLNEKGIIKKQYLPEGYPYAETIENPLIITQEMIDNATESIDVDGAVLKKVSSTPYSKQEIIGATLSVKYEGEELSGVITDDEIYEADGYFMVGDYFVSAKEAVNMDGVIFPIGFWAFDLSTEGIELELIGPSKVITKISDDFINIKEPSIPPIPPENERQIKHLFDGQGDGSLRTLRAEMESDEYKLGEGAFAEGVMAKASGLGSHASGSWTTASGHSSYAEGMNTIASGEASHAEGNYTTASGLCSHAKGNFTTASGDYSYAEGSHTVAASLYQHVQGSYNVVDDQQTYIHIVGGGYTEESRLNLHTLDYGGNAWFAGTVEGTALILKSSTAGSSKRFRITVDDSGTLNATEITW